MQVRRPVLASLTALLLAVGAAQGPDRPAGSSAEDKPFAALVIVSHGRQTIDIVTGLTTLPDGGTLRDAHTGVEVRAAVIKYVDGEYIEASGVTASGDFGDLVAEKLHIDVEGSVLTASGELRLSRDGLVVTAGSLRYHALEQVIVFDGGVTGTEPRFSADRVLLDTLNGDVLLDGRYEFAGALFTMRSPAAGGLLQLSLEQRGDEVVYSAATEVSPALLERFRAYL
ncbi:MAG TPA: hypothetical protein VF202_06700 [Trueperaceae bacterium]|jgi:hypothetical protein